MDTDKKRTKKTTIPTLVCKLSELGLCKRRFKPKRDWQDFCRPEHQQKYHRILKKEKRLLVNKVMNHERRITAIEKRLELKGEK